MSYDLVFWRQLGRLPEAPADIFARLTEGEAVPKVTELPTEAILKAIRAKFPTLITDGGMTYWDGDAEGFFEMDVSPRCIQFSCRELRAETMNALINVMIGFKCRLYDPQTKQRYD